MDSIRGTAAETSGLALSVILPVFNGETLLGQQLEALSRQDFQQPWELLLVDNGSSDRTLTVASKYRGRLPLTILHCERRGKSFALNAGVCQSRSDVLVFLDHDDVVDPSYLREMSTALQSAPFVGGRLEHGSLNPGWPDVLVGQQETLPGDWMPFSSGAAMGIRRDVFIEVGCFHDIPYAEDIDLSWRAQLAGYRPTFVPRAVLHYRHRSTARAAFAQSRNYGVGAVRLYTHYRALGQPSPDWQTVGLAYKSLLALLLRVLVSRDKSSWLRFAVRAGAALGRLEGSLRYRVLFL